MATRDDKGRFVNGSKPTSGFRKGHKAFNEVIPFTEHKGGQTRKVKMPDGRWVPKNRFVYEKNFGEIPKGSIVTFADRNSENYDPSNLLLVNRKELGLLSQMKIKSSDPDVNKALLSLAKLKIKLREVE